MDPNEVIAALRVLWAVKVLRGGRGSAGATPGATMPGCRN